MTEIEWLECTDPTPMLEFLKGKTSDRKLRLFACACCSSYWWSSSHLDIVERFADGMETADKLSDLADEFYEGILDAGTRCNARVMGDCEVLCCTCCQDAYDAAMCTAMKVADERCRVAEQTASSNTPHLGESARREALAEQTPLVREVFGNPFRPMVLSPSWLTWNDRTVPRIVQAIYDEKAFDRMPILADALEDSGCDNPDILNHLRGPGPHVRGCCVVDLLLGKK